MEIRKVKKKYDDVTHHDNKSMYQSDIREEEVFDNEAEIADINIFDTTDLDNEIIRLINRAYRKGFYNGRQYAKEIEAEEKAESLEEEEKPIKSCAMCVFCYLDKSDYVFKCKYYDDMSVYLLDPIQCENRISGNEFMELKKSHYKSFKDFCKIIDAFNYFKKDGGCDSCGSQRCPANAKMLLEGNYCKEFKKYLDEASTVPKSGIEYHTCSECRYWYGEKSADDQPGDFGYCSSRNDKVLYCHTSVACNAFEKKDAKTQCKQCKNYVEKANECYPYRHICSDDHSCPHWEKIITCGNCVFGDPINASLTGAVICHNSVVQQSKNYNEHCPIAIDRNDPKVANRVMEAKDLTTMLAAFDLFKQDCPKVCKNCNARLFAKCEMSLTNILNGKLCEPFRKWLDLTKNNN